MGEFNLDCMVVLKIVMRCFELVLDLKADFHKSRFGGIGVVFKEPKL